MLARVGVSIIRLVERRLPIACLHAILWPVAAVAACLPRSGWNLGVPFDHCPRP